MIRSLSSNFTSRCDMDTRNSEIKNSKNPSRFTDDNEGPYRVTTIQLIDCEKTFNVTITHQGTGPAPCTLNIVGSAVADISSDATTIDVSVNTTQNYSVENLPGWITVTNQTLSGFTLNVTENESTTAGRSVILNLDGCETGATFRVSQEQKSEECQFTLVNTSENVNTAEYSARTLVLINTNSTYSITSSPSWVFEIIEQADGFGYSVQPNDGAARTGDIVFEACGESYTFTVSQIAGTTPAPCVATTTTDEVEFTAAAGSQTFTLNTNADDVVVTTDPTTPWTSASYSSGVVTVSVDENTGLDRECKATITACDGAVVIEVAIIQLAPITDPACVATTTTTTLDFQPELGSQNFTLNTNADDVAVTTTPAGDWL